LVNNAVIFTKPSLTLSMQPVATLTLGSRLKQGFARLWAKREAGSHTTYSWECEKVWRNEPSHPKGVPFRELESRWTFKLSKGDCRGQNSMAWGVFLYQWKALKTWISKMGSHRPFGHLKHKLWPKERSGVKFGSLALDH
jgi:hypothetical protein